MSTMGCQLTFPAAPFPILSRDPSRKPPEILPDDGPEFLKKNHGLTRMGDQPLEGWVLFFCSFFSPFKPTHN